MLTLLTSLTIGFIAVVVGVPFARKYLLASGIYGIDQQKPGKPKIPTSGGLVVLFGFMFSVTSFLAMEKFFGSQSIEAVSVMAALNSVAVIALIGLIDDIHIDLQNLFNDHVDEEVELDLMDDYKPPKTRFIWEKISATRGESNRDIHRKGISQVYKMLFVLPAVLPLIAIGAGSWSMSFPIIGTINWGLIYPLVLLPLGLLFVSNVVNMLAGTNGLAAGMSLVASLGLGIFALMNNEIEAAAISLSLSASLLGFLYYNFYPSSILPGDSLTYLCGAVLFSAMVIGNMEKFGVFIFGPYFLEFLLKLRSGFKAHSWGELQSDGTIKPLHDKNYSLTHPLMRRGLSEKQITLCLVGFETVAVISALVIFYFGPL